MLTKWKMLAIVRGQRSPPMYSNVRFDKVSAFGSVWMALSYVAIALIIRLLMVGHLPKWPPSGWTTARKRSVSFVFRQLTDGCGINSCKTDYEKVETEDWWMTAPSRGRPFIPGVLFTGILLPGSRGANPWTAPPYKSCPRFRWYTTLPNEIRKINSHNIMVKFVVTRNCLFE